jgi:hypothetical protein
MVGLVIPDDAENTSAAKALNVSYVIRITNQIYNDLITTNQIETDQDGIPYNPRQALFQVVTGLKEVFGDRKDKSGRIAGQIAFDHWQPGWRSGKFGGSESHDKPPEGTHQIRKYLK